MPKLIRLYIRQVLFGFGLGTLFIGALLYSNVGNLWHLVSSSPMGWIAIWMLFIANGAVFAGVQFAITIMRMEEKDDGPSGGKRAPEPVLCAVPVPVDAAPKQG